MGSGALAALVVYFAAQAIQEDDALARSTWFLVAATTALMVATLSLVFVSVWQTRFTARFQEELDEKRRADEDRRTSRAFMEDKLSKEFSPAWRNAVVQLARSKGTRQADTVLETFGIRLKGLEQAFPELRVRLAGIHRAEYLRDLEAHDPEEYERVMRKEAEEQAEAERISMEQAIEGEEGRDG